MTSDIICSYVEKVYAYAVRRTFSRDEADELSQEILFTAVRELPKLRDESRFEPWLWGIAANVTRSFRRSMGKRRAMYSYDTAEDLLYYDEYDLDNENIFGALRTNIASLSALYRDVVILYYYDGLSTKAISERLGIPEGTVTWRLSEARKKLKKECENMETTALRPIVLEICMSGEGNYNGTTMPFPNQYLSDALAQNILFYCYDRPRGVEELAKLCGVPAYYIEDRLTDLVKREAVSEQSGGRYRTEFVIYSDKDAEYSIKSKCIFEHITEPFVNALRRLADMTDGLGIYTAGKPREELLYLYGILALLHFNERYNPTKTTGDRLRYDGNRWTYHAHLVSGAKHHVRGLGLQISSNRGSRGTYKHISCTFAGFAHRRMALDHMINICEDVKCGREITDLEAAAETIEKGYIEKRENGLFITIPMFTKEQYAKFVGYAEEAFADVILPYANAVKTFCDGYKKLFPAHLEDDLSVACNYMFLSQYATSLCDIAKERGLLTPPRPESICDVLIQHT